MEPAPQFAVVAQHTQPVPSRRQSPASSIVNMDTEEAPAPMVVTIGQVTDACIVGNAVETVARQGGQGALAKPRFTTVLSSQRVELPRVICGLEKNETDIHYFRSLLEAGLNEDLASRIGAVLFDDYFGCVEKSHSVFVPLYHKNAADA